jgi:6,7-dimethyl-8-ribityllumazine synthase
VATGRRMAESTAFLEEFTEEERGELGLREFAVCVGRFYEDLAERLLSGAREGFRIAGVGEDAIWEISVPGAYELPYAAKLCAESLRPAGVSRPARPRFSGVACLGVVIRGETDHYDFVCAEAARGIQDVQLDTGVPCSFGVITCDTMEQALARAGGGKRDQGRNAALTVARMALLQRRLA